MRNTANSNEFTILCNFSRITSQSLKHIANSLTSLSVILFFLSGCGAIDAEMFGSSKITDVGSNTPPKTPGPLIGYPVDLTAPLFRDDFNRPNELLTINPKWISFQGSSGFISNQEVGTDTGGAFLVPNKPFFSEFR